MAFKYKAYDRSQATGFFVHSKSSAAAEQAVMLLRERLGDDLEEFKKAYIDAGTNFEKHLRNACRQYSRERFKSAICADCGEDTTPCTGKQGCCHDGKWENYLVHNTIWRKAEMGKGFLCIACLETRLGRALTREDFQNAPVNCPADPRHTARLASRLGNRDNAEQEAR